MVTKLNSALSKILNQAFSSFGFALKPLMVSYFETLDDLLLELAEKADSDSKKKLYFESMRSIRVHKLNVLVSYLKTIQNVFHLFLNQDFVYFNDLNSAEMSFDQNDKSIRSSFNANDIEEKLMQNNLNHKFELSCQKSIDFTTLCFSTIIKNDLVSRQNPISPFVLISAFAKSIRLLHLDQKIKMILYKHYELQVLSKIPDLYKQTIDYLSSTQVNEIISKTKKISPVINKNNNYKITRSEINNVLSDLQSKHFKINKISPKAIKKVLMAQIGHIQLTESRHIDNHDLYCIDFVSMRFQLIGDDHNIHDSIKDIIYKLQIPYLKYLTEDDSFIDDKSHPAQLLLDTIHNSSLGWSANRDNKQIFIKKLKDTVAIIIEAPALTKSLFKVILQDYQEFLDLQENEFAIEQERIKTRERGKARIVSAMKTVDALIGLKTENITLPGFIKDIIFGPWKNLLSLLLVRHSDVSEEYLEKVGFIDDLIELLKSEQFDMIIESKIINLSEVYKQGLELVAYSGDVLEGKIKKFKDNLMKYHKLTDNSQDKKLAAEKNTSKNVINHRFENMSETIKAASNKKTEIKSPNLQGFNRQDILLLEKISMGDWVYFTRLNKEPVKAQLSWINPSTGKYIFVNDRGLKVTDKSAEELLVDLKSKNIIVET